MQQVYFDSRGYAWHRIDGSTGYYRRAVDLPGNVGVLQLLDKIETFYDQAPVVDWHTRRRFSLRGWKLRRSR